MSDQKLVAVVSVSVIVSADGDTEYVVSSDLSAEERIAHRIYDALPLVSHALAFASGSNQKEPA